MHTGDNDGDFDDRSWSPGYFPPARPKAVRGGIRAQSQRGAFGEKWWAKRWIAVLENFHLGARLKRGRSYARRGQVVSIEIGKANVLASVQGSRSSPYQVRIAVIPLGTKAWASVVATLAADPFLTAKLLAGEMPSDIEQVFERAQVALFPAKLTDLDTNCSCPDWANPCKHVAAVYYLIGEEFDRDPFLLLALRGMTRDELLTQLAASQPQPPAKMPARAKRKSQSRATAADPLQTDVSGFWRGLPKAGTIAANVEPPPIDAPLIRRLGSLPFWRGREPLLTVLQPHYAAASRAALEVLVANEKVLAE